MKTMMTRVVTGAALVAALSVALALGGWWFAVLFMASIGLSMYEMFRALKAAGHHPAEWPVWACAALSVPLLTATVGKSALLLPLLAGTCAVVIVCVMFRPNPELDDVFTSVLPLFSVLLPGMCMLGLFRAPSRQHELMLMILSFGVPLFGDAAAYFVGSMFGRRKLCEKISPHKSVEGATAGLAGSVIFALAVWLIFAGHIQLPPLWHALALGVLGGLAGQGGDLFASFIKRHCGVKDYGTIFPGHGGMMDRLDSVYWATVVMYVYMAWFL